MEARIMNKPDFVSELVAIVREVTPLSSYDAHQIEHSIRLQYGGERVRIEPKAPVSYEQIDSLQRQRKSVNVIAKELGCSRSTIYRFLERRKSPATKTGDRRT